MMSPTDTMLGIRIVEVMKKNQNILKFQALQIGIMW